MRRANASSRPWSAFEHGSLDAASPVPRSPRCQPFGQNRIQTIISINFIPKTVGKRKPIRKIISWLDMTSLLRDLPRKIVEQVNATYAEYVGFRRPGVKIAALEEGRMRDLTSHHPRAWQRPCRARPPDLCHLAPWRGRAWKRRGEEARPVEIGARWLGLARSTAYRWATRPCTHRCAPNASSRITSPANQGPVGYPACFSPSPSFLQPICKPNPNFKP